MAHYDKEARTYDDWYQTPKGKFMDEVETRLIFDLLKPQKGMKILDVGCGTGNFSIKLAKLGCKVTAIDYSEGMLVKALQNAGELAIEFIQMNASDLQFDDASFDAVLSVTAFEFIDDYQGAFNEMLRVAKPGANIAIATLNAASSWGRLYASDEMKQNSIFKYAHLKTLTDLEKLHGEKLITIGECLFMAPDANDSDFNLEQEEKLSGTTPGGLICGLWKK